MCEDLTVAQWGLASMLFIGVFMFGIFLCWLHGRDIHISWPIIRFLHRPIGEVIVVLMCVFGFMK